MNLIPYNTAVADVLNQISSAQNEIETLYITTLKTLRSNYTTSKYIVRKKAVGLLKHDMKIISAFNEYIKDEALKPSDPLKTNKLFELFNCASDLLLNTFIATTSLDIGLHTLQHDLGITDSDCLQTAMLSLLRAMNKATKLSDLKLENSSGSRIYNVDTSPVIQGVAMPEHCNDTFITDFKHWFFYYSDDKSPPQGELLVPNLGYAFGGSRSDPRYSNKIFKVEDCSSAMSKWLKSTVAFTTLDMINAFNDSCTNVSCKEVQKVLTPLVGVGPQYAVEGDVFLYRTPSGEEHTGFIVQKINSHCFKSLSCSNDITKKIEGYSSRELCTDVKDGSYMYFSPKHEEHDSSSSGSTLNNFVAEAHYYYYMSVGVLWLLDN